MGGETSERRRDIVEVLRAAELDDEYIRRVAAASELTRTLDRLFGG
jgi:hypothetical protein